MEAIREMRHNGMTLNEIVDRTGLSKRSISRTIHGVDAEAEHCYAQARIDQAIYWSGTPRIPRPGDDDYREPIEVDTQVAISEIARTNPMASMATIAAAVGVEIRIVAIMLGLPVPGPVRLVADFFRY